MGSGDEKSKSGGSQEGRKSNRKSKTNSNKKEKYNHREKQTKERRKEIEDSARKIPQQHKIIKYLQKKNRPGTPRGSPEEKLAATKEPELEEIEVKDPGGTINKGGSNQDPPLGNRSNILSDITSKDRISPHGEGGTQRKEKITTPKLSSNREGIGGSLKEGREERSLKEKKMAKAMADWLERDKASQSEAERQERKEEKTSRGKETRKNDKEK